MCGTLAACHLRSAVAPLVVWLQIGGGIILAALALWGLAKLRQAFGLPGVWAGVTALAGLAGVILGRRWGRQDATPQTTTRILRRDTIKSLQLALTARGLYAGEIDGIYGSATHAGVTAVERSLRLPVTPYDPEHVTLSIRVLDALGVTTR